MKNKHYPPSIEEFHVGFEYEERYDEDTPFFKEIVKDDIEEWPNYDQLSKIKWSIHNIRVKYLDKEDIESLRFKHILHSGGHLIKNSEDHFERGYNDPRKVNDKVALIYNYSERHLLITIGNYETPISDWKTLFAGIIKNISELNTILKQVKVTK